LKDIYGARYTGLIDTGGSIYHTYRIPNPEAPYPQDYIIDKNGKVRFWEGEYDPKECIKVIEDCLRYKPSVTVEIDPDSTMVHPGGSLGYTLTLKNNTDQLINFEVTCDQIGPSSSRQTLWGPLSHQLSAGDTLSLHLFESIPSGASLGNYSLKLKSGLAQDIWSVDGFNYIVY